MSKEHGLGNALYVAGHDLSGDTQSWGLSGSKPMQDTTTLRMKAFDRLGLIPDGAINYQTLLDNAVGNAHAYLSTLPTTDGLVTICHRELVGSPAGCMFGKQIGYDATRGGDGALTFKVDAQASKGSFVDWGVLLTDGMRVDTDGDERRELGFRCGARVRAASVPACVRVHRHERHDQAAVLERQRRG
jgi:hypothetical protein